MTASECWAASHEDCLWIDRVMPYRECRVAGVVRTLRLDPRANTFEMQITDGRTTARARWPLNAARPPLAAVPGAGLILEGTARLDLGSDVFLFDEPAFEVMPGPGV